jgi:hypothetical protein
MFLDPTWTLNDWVVLLQRLTSSPDDLRSGRFVSRQAAIWNSPATKSL